MNKQEQANLSLAESRLEQCYGNISTDSRKNTSRSYADSIDNAIEETEGSSKLTNRSVLAAEKKMSKQEKTAEGASQSTSDKSSSDKVKVHKSDSQAEEIHQQALSKIDMELKAKAIEIFIRTLKINTDLLNGTHKKNHYDYFLELLTFDDKESTIKHLLSSKETTSGVAIHCIPHFFFHEYVFNNNKGIDDVFNKLITLNSKKRESTKKLKTHVENQLRKFAGLVRLDDTYHGIPIYFYVKYFRKDYVFAEELRQPSLALIPLSDTGISAIDYLAFETALEKAHVPFKPDVVEDDYSETSQSTEADHSDDSEETVDRRNLPKTSIGKFHRDKADYQEDLPPEIVITLYSLCRISDLQQILESYIDMWYDEEFKKHLKYSTNPYAKQRDAIVSKVANFEESRHQRLNECQFFFNDMSNTNELATALNLLEHRLQKMYFKRKSRLRDILQSKILAIRKEEFFQQHKGKLVIYNIMFPNLLHLTEIREEMTEETILKQRQLEKLRGENGGLKGEIIELHAENQSLKDDNQRKKERNESLQDDNQRKQETIESLQEDNHRKQETNERLESEKQELQQTNNSLERDNLRKLETIVSLRDDNHRKQETIESLESDNQALQETIQRLQREMETGKPYSPCFFEYRQGLGGEVIDPEHNSKKDENPPKEEEKPSWFW